MREKCHTIGGSDGWLNVKRVDSGAIVSLPEYLSVEVTARRDGRDHFTVSEGPEAGAMLSVVSGHLGSGSPPRRASARLRFEIGRGLLSFPGGQARAVTYNRNPIPPGTHPIQIPDFPHPGGSHYMGQSRYAKSWFYLGHGRATPGRDDRYLHCGNVSAGCVTVNPADWTDLYKYLILCRSGDGRTIGSVTVVA